MSSATEHAFEPNAAVERRFYSRSAPSSMLYVTFGQINQALLLNLSENGVLLSSPQNLDCNFVARLSMNLPGLPKVIQVHARVLWTSGEQKRAGIQFINLSEHDREQIRKWQVLESSRRPVELQQEPSGAVASENSTAAHQPAIPRESPASASTIAPEAQVNDFTKPAKPPQNQENLTMEMPPADVAMPSRFQIHPPDWATRRKARESALAICMWAAVPIVIAIGIILLIRSGALPNPLAPSPSDRNDIVSSAGAEFPDLKHPNPSTTIAQGQAKAAANNTVSSRRRNSDPEDTLVDSSTLMNDRTNGPHETLGIAGINSAPRADAQPSAPAPQEPNHPDAVDSRVERVRGNSTRSQTVAPDLMQTRASQDQPEHLDAPQAELSGRNEPALNPTTPNDPAGWSNIGRIPKAAGASYLARKLRPGVNTNASEREVIEVRPEGHGTSFVNLPGARVLESGQMTLCIQRSVLIRGGVKWWPLHRNKKVALGELLSRVDPRISQIPIPSDTAVKVRAAIGEDGHVESVEPLGGPTALVPIVAEAVREWRYQPTLVDGKPVETQADVEIQFHTRTAQSAKP